MAQSESFDKNKTKEQVVEEFLTSFISTWEPITRAKRLNKTKIESIIQDIGHNLHDFSLMALKNYTLINNDRFAPLMRTEAIINKAITNERLRYIKKHNAVYSEIEREPKYHGIFFDDDFWGESIHFKDRLKLAGKNKIIPNLTKYDNPQVNFNARPHRQDINFFFQGVWINALSSTSVSRQLKIFLAHNIFYYPGTSLTEEAASLKTKQEIADDISYSKPSHQVEKNSLIRLGKFPVWWIHLKELHNIATICRYWQISLRYASMLYHRACTKLNQELKKIDDIKHVLYLGKELVKEENSREYEWGTEKYSTDYMVKEKLSRYGKDMVFDVFSIMTRSIENGVLRLYSKLYESSKSKTQATVQKKDWTKMNDEKLVEDFEGEIKNLEVKSDTLEGDYEQYRDRPEFQDRYAKFIDKAKFYPPLETWGSFVRSSSKESRPKDIIKTVSWVGIVLDGDAFLTSPLFLDMSYACNQKKIYNRCFDKDKAYFYEDPELVCVYRCKDLQLLKFEVSCVKDFSIYDCPNLTMVDSHVERFYDISTKDVKYSAIEPTIEHKRDFVTFSFDGSIVRELPSVYKLGYPPTSDIKKVNDDYIQSIIDDKATVTFGTRLRHFLCHGCPYVYNQTTPFAQCFSIDAFNHVINEMEISGNDSEENYGKLMYNRLWSLCSYMSICSCVTSSWSGAAFDTTLTYNLYDLIRPFRKDDKKFRENKFRENLRDTDFFKKYPCHLEIIRLKNINLIRPRTDDENATGQDPNGDSIDSIDSLTWSTKYFDSEEESEFTYACVFATSIEQRSTDKIKKEKIKLDLIENNKKLSTDEFLGVCPNVKAHYETVEDFDDIYLDMVDPKNDTEIADIIDDTSINVRRKNAVSGARPSLPQGFTPGKASPRPYQVIPSQGGKGIKRISPRGPPRKAPHYPRNDESENTVQSNDEPDIRPKATSKRPASHERESSKKKTTGEAELRSTMDRITSKSIDNDNVTLEDLYVTTRGYSKKEEQVKDDNESPLYISDVYYPQTYTSRYYRLSSTYRSEKTFVQPVVDVEGNINQKIIILKRERSARSIYTTYFPYNRLVYDAAKRLDRYPCAIPFISDSLAASLNSHIYKTRIFSRTLNVICDRTHKKPEEIRHMLGVEENDPAVFFWFFFEIVLAQVYSRSLTLARYYELLRIFLNLAYKDWRRLSFENTQNISRSDERDVFDKRILYNLLFESIKTSTTVQKFRNVFSQSINSGEYIDLNSLSGLKILKNGIAKKEKKALGNVLTEDMMKRIEDYVGIPNINEIPVEKSFDIPDELYADLVDLFWNESEPEGSSFRTGPYFFLLKILEGLIGQWNFIFDLSGSDKDEMLIGRNTSRTWTHGFLKSISISDIKKKTDSGEKYRFVEDYQPIEVLTKNLILFFGNEQYVRGFLQHGDDTSDLAKKHRVLKDRDIQTLMDIALYDSGELIAEAAGIAQLKKYLLS